MKISIVGCKVAVLFFAIATNALSQSSENEIDQRIEAQNRAHEERWQLMKKESEEIAARIEAGDFSAYDLCSKDREGNMRGGDFYNTCIPIADKAAAKALRSKKIVPINCRMWEIANTDERSFHRSVIPVTLESKGKSGPFSGEVTHLNGKTLVVYNRTFQTSAIVNLGNETKIYNGDSVGVGMAVYGFGIQTGSRISSGQGKTVAVINAKCIGSN